MVETPPETAVATENAFTADHFDGLSDCNDSNITSDTTNKKIDIERLLTTKTIKGTVMVIRSPKIFAIVGCDFQKSPLIISISLVASGTEVI
ncbi:hypothetical protein D3C86_1975210 [compost metagenome]